MCFHSHFAGFVFVTKSWKVLWRFYESSHPIRDGETNIYLTFIFVFTESHQKSWFQKSNKSKDYSFFYTYAHFNFLSLREHFEFENLAWKKKWKEMKVWNFSKYWGDACRRVLEVETISSSLWHKFHSIDLANRLNEWSRWDLISQSQRT